VSWYVIEGPDDVGKTTLARGLERRGWAYQHCDHTDELPILARRMAALLGVKNVVWDRAHLGEMVHHSERIDLRWYSLIETILHSIEARCILLTQRVGTDPRENNATTHSRLVNEFLMASTWSGLVWTTSWPDPMPWATD
jgi:hypothetical protein